VARLTFLALISLSTLFFQFHESITLIILENRNGKELDKKHHNIPYLKNYIYVISTLCRIRLISLYCNYFTPGHVLLPVDYFLRLLALYRRCAASSHSCAVAPQHLYLTDFPVQCYSKSVVCNARFDGRLFRGSANTLL
jgi:hypothetical protein